MIKQWFHSLYVYLLTCEARALRNKHTSKLIAVTGSIGKTSTRDAIATVLRSQYNVRANERNFNLHVGVARTVLGVPVAKHFFKKVGNMLYGAYTLTRRTLHPDFMVVEVGVTQQGDMEKFLWLAPDVVVYTKFPDIPAHVGRFADAQSVIHEKLRLAQVINPNGVFVINADDTRMRDACTHISQQRITYGVQTLADVYAEDVRIVYEGGVPSGISATIVHQDQVGDVYVRGTLGAHLVYPLLAAVAVGVYEGIPLRQATSALNNHVGPRARMRILRGAHGGIVVDDSYNAAPDAVVAGIKTMQELNVRGRKVFVLGDMLELGVLTNKAHANVRDQLTRGGFDVLVTVGDAMQNIAEALRKEMHDTEIITCSDTEKATEHVRHTLTKDDVVYVKGSGGMHMGNIVYSLVVPEDRVHTIHHTHS